MSKKRLIQVDALLLKLYLNYNALLGETFRYSVVVQV